MEYTISFVTERLHRKLAEYIETQYPISEPSLQRKRTELLYKSGVISTDPFIESTPVYQPGDLYMNMDIPATAKNLMTELASLNPSVGVFPRPYLHQQKAMESFITHNNDLIVSTGTGSGKTETFLHPVLNTLYKEASERKKGFKKRAVRALILYPMNALVSDQMTRLRRLFGDERVKKIFHNAADRSIQFGMYTSRTPYAGAHSASKDRYQLNDILDYYIKLEETMPDKVKLMRERGKWPAKDLKAFKNSKKNNRDRYHGQPSDAELFTRHEMQDTPPDILVTNYSMLEYMLMRPIESFIWEETKEWLDENDENQFILILDEAHMYRGTGGAEVALLIRRLQSRLGIERDRMKCILTSASLGKEDQKEGPIKFAEQLTGKPKRRKYELIKGTKEMRIQAKNATLEEMLTLASMDSNLFINCKTNYEGNIQGMQKFFDSMMWPNPPIEHKKFAEYLFDQLNEFGPLDKVINQISGQATSLKEMVALICPDIDSNIGEKAISNLLLLANSAQKNGRVLLPARVHVFFRGLSGIFTCINPKCTSDIDKELGGKIFDDYRLTCDCGSRVYEVLTHRYCGSAFIKGYIQENVQYPTYLWNESGHGIVGEKLKEIHLLVEQPHENALEKNRISPLWIHIETGYINNVPPASMEGYIQVYESVEKISKRRHNRYFSNAYSFEKCPCCLKSAKYNIRDLRIKGEQPFANLIREQFIIQPPVEGKEENVNEGRKVLIFSDGRQKAARLARDIPSEVEKDAIRQLILKAAYELESHGIRATIGRELYPTVLHYIHENDLLLFSQLQRKDLIKDVKSYVKEFYEQELSNVEFDEISISIREEFKLRMLEIIASPGYSIYDTTTGVVIPANMRRLYRDNQIQEWITKEDLEKIAILFIKELLDNVAIDISLDVYDRRELLGVYRDDSEWGKKSHTISKQLKSIINGYVGEKHTETLIQQLFDQLCRSQLDKYYLDLDKLKIRDGINLTWYKCTSCKQIHAVVPHNLCPSCNAKTIVELPPNSDMLKAEKGYWRTPITEVLIGKKITNVTVEEHTAQLSQKDPSIALATTEQYEMSFQDIVLDESLGIVDILSCTTTMEVGIDIGSLTAVGMRNIPPQRENYQQRAGRAGRRGSSLSTVITYAQDGPHDHYYFNNPQQIISGNTREALIYINNKKIIRRHLNAILIQTYFHFHSSDGERKISNISETLGTTNDFFKSLSPFNLDSFEEWLIKLVKIKFKQYPEIFSIIPEEAITNEDEKWKLIKESADNLSQDLYDVYCKIAEELNSYEELIDEEDQFSEQHPDELLLNFLFNHGFLPTYAFPKDLSSLYIQGRDKRNKVIIEQRPQLELNRALGEYAPGRQIVINKKTYRVGGIYNPFSKNPDAPARDLNLHGEYVALCVKCNYTRISSEQLEKCPNCEEDLKSMPYIRPTGFSPERGREVNKGDLTQEYSFASTPQLPVPNETEEIDFKNLNKLAFIQFEHRENEDLIIINRGIDGESGFLMCEDCGFIKPVIENQDLSKGHFKPFQRQGMVETKCSGSLHQIYLGNRFTSDLFLIRLNIDRKIDFNASKQWLHDALLTLGEGIVLAASRILDIDAQELTAGYRIVHNEQGDSYVDLYIFDTLSGGAGYSFVAGEYIKEIIEETFNVLKHCPNNCESSCYKCMRNYQNQMKHEHLNRPLGLELLTYLVNGKLTRYTLSEQTHFLKPVKAAFNLHHGENYANFIEENGNMYIKLDDGVMIGVKNNIEKKLSSKNLYYYSPYEIKFDLPNVYELI
ncbi:DEAD/DEAH box helicase [Rossellomorea sp. NPDC071047]|uniref:DEAD/DEAH box helicase n=1 Tax=Rossellomorea sp. NPDC071047 TaxID=3390675 RepID=UPI003D0934D8